MARKREDRSGKVSHKKDRKAKNTKLTQDEQNFTSFNNQLAEMGLILREVPGDGNCLFRALGDQLEGHTRNHLQHRQATVEHMRQHRKDFEPFVEDNIPFDSYVNNLEKPGTYAGNDAIVAFARQHSVTVVIHQLNSPLWKVHGSEPNKPNRELHVAYHNGDHYNSIRKIGDTSENPANINISSDVVTMPTPKPQSYYNNYYKDSCDEETESEDEDNDLVQSVMEKSGCEDRQLVEQTLHKHCYDLTETVKGLLELMLMSQEEESPKTDDDISYGPSDSEPSIWSPNGTGTRIFGSCSDLINDSNINSGGAKQKFPKTLPYVTQPKNHVSNKQRKEMKKQTRKANGELRKKQTRASLENSDLNKLTSALVQKLGCVNI